MLKYSTGQYVLILHMRFHTAVPIAGGDDLSHFCGGCEEVNGNPLNAGENLYIGWVH